MNHQRLWVCSALLVSVALGTSGCMARLAAAQSRARSRILGRIRGGGEQSGSLRRRSRQRQAGHSLGGYTVLGLAGGWPSWKLPEVKAVLALSPYCSPLAQKGRLSAIKVPVMYQGGTRDLGITPSVIKGRGAYDQTTGNVYW